MLGVFNRDDEQHATRHEHKQLFEALGYRATRGLHNRSPASCRGCIPSSQTHERRRCTALRRSILGGPFCQRGDRILVQLVTRLAACVGRPYSRICSHHFHRASDLNHQPG